MSFKLAELFVAVTADTKDFNMKLAGVRSSALNTRGMLEALGAAAKRVFLASMGAITAAVAATAKYEKSMVRVFAVTRANAQEAAQLTRITKELGTTTIYSAVEVADAARYLAIAGFSVSEIMTALPAVMDLAAAGQLNVAEASDYTAKIMRGMGIEAGGLRMVADMLSKAFTSVNTDLHQFSEAMTYVGPVARLTKYALNEVGAAVMIVSNAGIQAERAGTGLRRFLAQLSKEASPAAVHLKRLGVATMDAQGNLRPLPAIVDELGAALKKAAPRAQHLGMLIDIFGLRAGPAVAALLEAGGKQIKEYEQLLAEAGGTAKDLADKQLNTLWGRLKQLKNVVFQTANTFGEIFKPAVMDAIEVVKELHKKIHALSGKMKESIASVTALTAVGSGLLLVLLGLGRTLSFLATHPIVVLVAALGTLLLKLAYASAEGNTFAEKMAGMWAMVKPYWQSFVSWITTVFNMIYSVVQTVCDWLLVNVPKVWSSIVEYTAPILRAYWELVKQYWTLIRDTIVTVGSWISSTVLAVWTDVYDTMARTLDWLQVIVITAFAAISFAIKEWRAMVNYSMASAVYEIIKFANECEHFLIKVIPAYAKWFWENWRDIFTDVFELTKTIFSNMAKNVGSFFSALWGWLKGEDWEFAWTPLTEGFEAAVKEWPKIAEREIGELESVMAAEVESLGNDLNASWEEHLQEFMNKAFNPASPLPVKPPPAPDTEEDEEDYGAKIPGEPDETDKPDGAEFGALAADAINKKTRVFSGIEDYAKELQTAALTKDKVEQEQLEQLKQVNANLKTLNEKPYDPLVGP